LSSTRPRFPVRRHDSALPSAALRPAAIAGTSIGSLVGGFAAAGRLDALVAELRGMDLKRVIGLFAERKLPRAGLVDGRHVIDLIREHLGNPVIEELPIPFAAVATDAENGAEVVLDRGDLVTAIRASISIPGMFSPVLWQGHYLVDGGLVNPLPVSVLAARGDLDAVVAVNLHGDGLTPFGREPGPSSVRGRFPAGSTLHWLDRQKEKLETTARSAMKRWLAGADGPNIFQVMTHTVDIVSARLTTVCLRATPPSLLIEPRVGGIGHLEFHRVEEAVDAGYAAASAALERWSSRGAA
jgi:NTE family protein